MGLRRRWSQACTKPPRRRSPNGLDGSARKVSRVCRIVAQDLFHCRAKPRLPHARSLRLCAVSATPASKLPRKSVCLRQPRPAPARAKPDTRPGAGRTGAPYERAAPGEMIHIDIKKLGRFEQIGHRITGDRTRQSSRRGNGWGAGWEFVHVCIDDHSRIAFSQIKPDEKADSAVPFLKAAVAYYKSLGIKVERVMTDNGPCYKSFSFRDACIDLGIKHIRTKPSTPKTNAKAERLIQTPLREWAYAQAYPTSDRRAEELPIWLHRYNWHRPHGGIKSQTPISRLGQSEDNLLRLHI